MNIDKKRTRITDFHIVKTIEYKDSPVETVKNLERLHKDKFEFINIPWFRYEVSGHSLTIISEYIKGRYIDLAHMNYLWNDVVMHKGDYSFHDYQFSNFIVDKDNKVWAVDLDDYCKISISDRDKDWLKIKNEETLRLKELWNAL